MLRVANSTPMVDLESRLNSLRVNRLNRLDFPTPESPISTTAKGKRCQFRIARGGGVLSCSPLNRNCARDSSVSRGPLAAEAQRRNSHRIRRSPWLYVFGEGEGWGRGRVVVGGGRKAKVTMGLWVMYWITARGHKSAAFFGERTRASKKHRQSIK